MVVEDAVRELFVIDEYVLETVRVEGKFTEKPEIVSLV